MPALIGAVWAAVFLALLNGSRPAREAALAALTAVMLATLVFSEVLSAFRGVSFFWLCSSWTALLGIMVVSLRARIRRGLGVARRHPGVREWDRVDWLVAVVLLFFAAGTLLSAMLYPIVNFDSLTCHSARVFFWSQNHSIAPYATAFGPQLFEGPLGAYVVLNLKVLAGGSDRLSNLVQWFAYLFSIAGTSLIAMRLGASRRGQQAVAIAAATIPMAVLQASTTQNDLNVAVSCLIAVYCGVTYLHERKEGSSNLLWAGWTGCALGLALLAKPTSYMFCFPFFIWFAVSLVRRDGWKRTAALTSTVLLIALALNAPWYVSNSRLLGGIDVIGVSAPGVDQAVSHRHDLQGLLTTALKNGSMELGTPSDSVNRRIAGAVGVVVRSYSGVLEDPRAKESADVVYRLDNRITNHDVAPSPLTVLLVAISTAIILGSAHVAPRAKWYLLCAFAGGCLLAALISWNLYINRLLLPPLVLGTPVIGVAVTVALERRRRILLAVLVTAVALSAGYAAIAMLFNTTNRLVPPSVLPFSVGHRDLGAWNTSYDDLRFRVLTPELETPYKSMAAAIDEARITRVGLDVRTGVGWYPIYPLLWLLRDHQVGYVRETLFPDKLDASGFSPQAIVEIVPRDEYPAVLGDGRARGRALLAPQFTPDHVLLLYAVP